MKYEINVIRLDDAVFELLVLDLVVSAFVLLLLLMLRGGMVLSFFGFKFCTVSLVMGMRVGGIVSTPSLELFNVG